MNVRRFIGKKVSMEKIYERATYVYTPEETGEKYTIAEIFIDGDCLWSIPEGYNYDAFSVTLFIEDDRIIKISRSAYEYYCNCDYCSINLAKFPGRAMEKEAENILLSLLK